MKDSQQNLIQEFVTGKVGRRSFMTRAMALGLSMSSVGAIIAACGGSGSSSSSDITWSNWANTGELVRFQAFTKDYNTKHKTNVQYTYIPTANNNYFAKISTELSGGDAPDVFYVGDSDIGKLVANQTIMELGPLLSSSKSQEKADDYLPGLWGAAKTSNGKIYGVPVDCNPYVLWYNKKVLAAAGVQQMPADIYESGKWTRDAFQEIIDKVTASGKSGYVMDSGSNEYYAWCTTNGGKIYDKDGYGDFIAMDDEKTMDGLNWLVQNVRSKKIVYAGSLPKNQGSDLVFIGGQTGFISIGRWDLPEFKAASGLEYDCVPYPTPTGKIGSAPVALAYMVINKKTKLQDKAFDFMTNFVSAAGQKFRLSGGGNAVPSIQSVSTEEVVLEGNDPAHAKYLIDSRNTGYGLFPAEGGTPGLTDDIKTALDPVWLQGKDMKTTLANFAKTANPRIQKAQQSLH